MVDLEILRVLLVEDNVSTMNTLKIMLKEMGITQVYLANNGEDADEFFMNIGNDIDLVISDWNMPKKSGADFLESIRINRPDMPFIMITARADENSVKDAIDMGVTAYIRKPVSMRELEAKVRSVAKRLQGINE